MLHTKSPIHSVVYACLLVASEVQTAVAEWKALIQEGYDSQSDVTDNTLIDLIINVLAVFTAHLVYSPVQLVSLVTPDWSVWSKPYLVGEFDVSFPLLAPLLFVTEVCFEPIEYRQYQRWCKQVHLPAIGNYEELQSRWLRFCKYCEPSGVWATLS